MVSEKFEIALVLLRQFHSFKKRVITNTNKSISLLFIIITTIASPLMGKKILKHIAKHIAYHLSNECTNWTHLLFNNLFHCVAVLICFIALFIAFSNFVSFQIQIALKLA